MRLTIPGALLTAFVLIRATQPFDSLAVQLIWIVSGLLCLVSLRWGATVLALVTWYIVTSFYFANHLLFAAWIATTFAIFPNHEQRQLVVRWQLTILYAFTAISKLNGEWLSGAALGRIVADGYGVELPAIVLTVGAIGGAAVEAFLAGALWVRRLRTLVLVAAAVAHVSFWFAIGPPLEFAWALLSFNGLAFGMLAWSTAPTRSRMARRTRAPATA